MGKRLTTVFTFKIKSTFDQWLEFFDSKESGERLSEFDIKPLYRGQSKQDPQKLLLFIRLLRAICKSSLKSMALG